MTLITQSAYRAFIILLVGAFVMATVPADQAQARGRGRGWAAGAGALLLLYGLSQAQKRESYHNQRVRVRRGGSSNYAASSNTRGKRSAVKEQHETTGYKPSGQSSNADGYKRDGSGVTNGPSVNTDVAAGLRAIRSE